ncbi:oxidoreductase [Erwinia billingiae]|uniref:oxidoreductase n=1 Tax=Erwinia billingiae TaxID=182337 RepID=UPI00320B3391
MNKIVITFLGILFCKAAFSATFTLVNNGTETPISTADLQKLAVSKISTSTNFTPFAEFEGATLSSFAKSYNVQGGLLRVYALDDYSYTIPLRELEKFNAIIAYKKNGTMMPVSDLGPFAIIYPRDQHPELNSLDVNAKTVWQIKRIEVVE